MKISYSWLKEFIDLQESPAEIGALLTGSGLEVENVEKHELIEGGLEGLVIGEVITCEKHPDADKLSKTTVNVGNGVVVPIVCGAPNVAVGQKVIVATVGATLYPKGHDPFKIKKAKIRGEVSEGMICAEDEIGLGDGHDGIMVLSTDLPAGTPAARYFGLEPDYIFEIGLTPNRGDAASHYGVARDLKALLKRELRKPDHTIVNAEATIPFSVEVDNNEACIRYSGVVVSGIQVASSPEWLQSKIRAIGLAPINNIVDITNYILHDLGQPLHAFDLDKITGKKIVVRNAKQGEKLVTLDGVNRSLNTCDLVIANEKEPMCIAGVFGGQESGVSDTTTAIFLESACFFPDSIRKTSMDHALKTDSSFRFERGTDPEMPVYAMAKAVAMIMEIAGGKVASPVYDIYPSKVAKAVVQTSYERISMLVGKEIPNEEIKTILTNLDIRICGEEGDRLELEIPAYRIDVKREADVIEEIIRIYGYDNIEISDRISAGYLADFPDSDTDKIKSSLGETLAACGFSEIITNSLTKPEYALHLGIKEGQVEILNKLSEDLGVLRQSLLFSGLEVVQYNINRKQKDLKLFEFGKTYFKAEQGYREYEKLVLFITGSVHSESWADKQVPAGFYNLKAEVHKVLDKMNMRGFSSETVQNQVMKYGLTYKLNGKELVSFGLVHDKVLKVADIRQAVWYAEFDTELLYKMYNADLVYSEVSKFPEVRRDLSLIIDQSINFAKIKALAEQKERKLLQSVNVFDVYEGSNIGEGKKSYSISFSLLDKEKTLTDPVIDKTMEKLIMAFETELGAVIRK